MRKTPQEKKKLAYGKEQRSLSEYPHLARRNRPKIKQLFNQNYRSFVKNSIRKQLAEDPDELNVNSVKRQKYYGSAGLPLKKYIKLQYKRKIGRIGFNYSKMRNYDCLSIESQSSFHLFIEEVMNDKGQEAYDFKLYLKSLFTEVKYAYIYRIEKEFWSSFIESNSDLSIRFEQWLEL